MFGRTQCLTGRLSSFTRGVGESLLCVVIAQGFMHHSASKRVSSQPAVSVHSELAVEEVGAV